MTNLTCSFSDYLREGIEGNLPFDGDGQLRVPSYITHAIDNMVCERSPMRQLTDVETIDSDTFQDGISRKMIRVHELYAQPKATQKLIDDSNVDIETWLATKAADIFARKEDDVFINGDGIGKPRGILTYSDVIETIPTESKDITANKIHELYFSLNESYRKNACCLMHRDTCDIVKLIKDADNEYLFNVGLTSDKRDTLYGMPIYVDSNMPTPTAGNVCIAIGDFKQAYKIVDRTGVRVLRDPFTDKPFVKFYITKRVGGDVVDCDAIKLLRFND